MKKSFVFSLVFMTLLCKGQNSFMDSLKVSLKNATHDTTRCKILNIMIENEEDEQMWPKFNRELFQLTSKKLQSLKSTGREFYLYRLYFAAAINNMGLLAKRDGKIHEATNYYQGSLKISEEIGDKQGIATALNNLGLILQERGDVPSALSYSLKSLKIYEEIGDKDGAAYLFNNIAGIYHDQGDFSTAILHYQKSLKIREELGDKFGMANSYNNLGVVYSETGEVSRALEFFEKGIKLLKEMEDKKGLINALNNVGLIYQGQENAGKKLTDSGIYKSGSAKSIMYFNECLDLSEEIGDKEGICVSLNNIGGYYLEQGDYAKALEYTTGSLIIARELGYPNMIKNSAEKLGVIYKSSGNFKLALENVELYVQMRDSIANEQNKKESIRSHLKYEYEKKAAADSVKTAEEKKVVRAQLKQEQVQRYSLYIGLALVLIFALFMVNRFRITNKQKKLIEEQKRIVERQKHIVEEKQREILDSIYYARRIQRALISSEFYIKRELLKLTRK